MITLMWWHILLFLFIWSGLTYIFCKSYCKCKLNGLKKTAIKLKFVIEEAIKDKIIDPDESKDLPEAVLDLEEKAIK